MDHILWTSSWYGQTRWKNKQSCGTNLTNGREKITWWSKDFYEESNESIVVDWVTGLGLSLYGSYSAVSYQLICSKFPFSRSSKTGYRKNTTEQLNFGKTEHESKWAIRSKVCWCPLKVIIIEIYPGSLSS